MPRDLFGDVVHHDLRVGTRAWYSLPLTIFVHAIILAGVVIVPLVAIDELPGLPRTAAEYVVVAPPQPPPDAPRAPRRTPTGRPAVNPQAAPVEAPAGVAPEPGPVPEPEPAAGSGVSGGLPGSVDGTGLAVQPEAPPPAAPVTPVRITSDLRRPAKIKTCCPCTPTSRCARASQGW